MIVLFFIAFMFAWLFIASLLLEWLWNMTIPDLFNLSKITYWQAFRLLIISALLFSGLGIKFINF